MRINILYDVPCFDVCLAHVVTVWLCMTILEQFHAIRITIVIAGFVPNYCAIVLHIYSYPCLHSVQLLGLL